MRRRPPRATRTDTLLPYTTLCRSIFGVANAGVEIGIIAYLRRQVESAVRRLVKGWPDRILLRGICQQGEQSAAQRAAGASAKRQQIGRAHVLTPVTNAHLVCRLLLEKKTVICKKKKQKRKIR